MQDVRERSRAAKANAKTPNLRRTLLNLTKPILPLIANQEIQITCLTKRKLGQTVPIILLILALIVGACQLNSEVVLQHPLSLVRLIVGLAALM